MVNILRIRDVIFISVFASSVLNFIFSLLLVIRFGFTGLSFYGFFLSGGTVAVVVTSLVFSRLKPGAFPIATMVMTEAIWCGFLALLWVSWGGISVAAISIGIWGLINFFALTGWAITLTVFGAKNHHWKSDVCQTDITQMKVSSKKSANGLPNNSMASLQTV